MNWKYCPQCGQAGTLEQPTQVMTKCSNCDFVHFNNAKGSVAIVLVKDSKMLVSKRGRETDANFGLNEFPGGFIDFESAQAAAIREAKEELGVTIALDDLELLDVYWNDYNVAKFNVFSIDVAFAVRHWQGEIHAQDDVASVEWKPFDFVYHDSFCQKHYGGIDKKIEALLR